jgi:sec-independent protein translocase protein TatA
MPNLGMPEILVIAFLILLLFGANKIPQFMKNLGSGMKEFKKAVNPEEPKEAKVEQIANKENKELADKQN